MNQTEKKMWTILKECPDCKKQKLQDNGCRTIIGPCYWQSCPVCDWNNHSEAHEKLSQIAKEIIERKSGEKIDE